MNPDIAPPQVSFFGLGLEKSLVLALHLCGFRDPSAVQYETIPLVLDGNHVIARAKAGTGKTGSYLIPAINAAIRDPRALQQTVIFAPSLELVAQIAEVGRGICEMLKQRFNLEVKIAECHSGVALTKNAREAASAHILVGTTDRVDILIEGGFIDAKKMRLVVLDDADLMITHPFVDDITSVIKAAPENVQIVCATDSLPPIFVSWARKNMQPELLKVVNVGRETLVPQGLTQYYLPITPDKKIRALRKVLGMVVADRVLVFCNSTQTAEDVYNVLESHGVSAMLSHEELPSRDRLKILEEYKHGDTRVLVTTDLYQRGIDNQDVNVVINFDLPKDFESYIHRVERGGRWGQRAVAITFVTEDEEARREKFDEVMNNVMEYLPGEIVEDLYAH